ncbi:hypothetical protein AGMMS49959_12880 [Planctomycetales bacterium]|nr:hypothetical protein AGMMS49959_12880 [Planctomycetales bacterium]
MLTFRKKFIGGVALIAAAVNVVHTAHTARADEPPVKYVNTHSFLVQVKPADRDARDAVAAELYISRFPQSGWLPEGACAVAGDYGDKTFSRTVSVPGDGAYFFTSRGVDRVGAAPAPRPGEAAQVKVIADTAAPQVKIITPLRHAIFRAGENARLEWTATDQNLALNGVGIYYSTDGANWNAVAENLPNTGHYNWQIPPENFYLRVTARDNAGNTGGDESPAPFKVMVGGSQFASAAAVNNNNVGENATPTVYYPEAVVGTRPAATETLAPNIPNETPKNAPAAADKFLPTDPRPATRHPQLDANDGEIPQRADDGKAAYIAYVMGGNLVRQGRLKDSLRYFRSAVDIDPNFDQAWNDMGLVYKQLGAFTKADACLVRALNIEPENPRYLNARGTIYQAAGLDILRDPSSGDESLARANDLILFAVKTFGAAVDEALRRGSLAERAETYFHLGEICYFANQDPTGARQYWLKVLDLHTPTPDLDEVMLDRGTPQERLTRSVYEKNTELWVNLNTWREWAREYIRQLNDLERGVELPRAPFGGSLFAPLALGAGTAPVAASPETLTLLPDGSYATTTRGYTALSPVAANNQPQVQVINNYIDATPAAATPGNAARLPMGVVGAVNQKPNAAYAATRYYEEGKDGVYETYQREMFSRNPPQPARSRAGGADLIREHEPYNPANGYRYQPVPSVPTGRGAWLQPQYGNGVDYTYKR